MNNDELLFELYNRLDYDRERGELRRKAGFTGVKAGVLVGSPDTNGQLQATFLGVRYMVHSLVWFMETGCLPEGVIHHVNGDNLDNRFDNLTDDYTLTARAAIVRVGNAVRFWNPPKPSTAMSKAERLQRDRERRANNRDKYREIIRKSCQKHHAINKSNPEYRAAKACRQTLNRVVQSINGIKAMRTEAAHGYTVEQFRQHIEAQFADWMHWGNHGEWHVDHIKPVSAFVSEGVTDPRVINALDNLQPLAASENLRKGARYAVSH